jgi:nitrous oxide reductase
MSGEVNYNRRRFLGTAAITIAAAGAVGVGGYTESRAAAQRSMSGSAGTPSSTGGTHSSFSSLKQIDAGELNIGYA